MYRLLKNHLRMSLCSTMNVRYFCCKYLISQKFDRSTRLVLGHCDFEALKQTKLITLVTDLNWNKYTLPGASTINHMTDSCYCIDIISRYKLYLYLSILFMCDARHISHPFYHAVFETRLFILISQRTTLRTLVLSAQTRLGSNYGTILGQRISHF